MSTGTIENVDPRTLTIALNVRTDVTIDKAFVASVKELGILQPPMVTPNQDGGYDVVLGQRRTLAAVEAGLATIPVYVVDQSEADAARVVDQLTENDQRQGLSELERVAGYKQLSLFGLSPAQIVKKTATDRKVIDKALGVAGNETASAAMVEHELTLDQAAYLVEFEGDPDAVDSLVRAAGKGQLDHVVGDLRKKAALAQLIVDLQSELAAEKVTQLALSTSSYAGTQEGDPKHGRWTRLDKLGKPEDPTIPLEVAAVPKKFVGGRVVSDYMPHPETGGYAKWAAKQYFVLDAEDNGFGTLQYQQRERTPEQVAADEERDAAARVREEARAARDAADEVRWQWVEEFLQRKTLPEMLPFIAAVQAVAHPSHTQELVTEALAATDAKAALRVIIRSTFEGAEEAVRSRYYSGEPHPDALLVADVYLPLIQDLGYGLSDVELSLLELARTDEIEESNNVEGDDDGDYEDE